MKPYDSITDTAVSDLRLLGISTSVWPASSASRRTSTPTGSSNRCQPPHGLGEGVWRVRAQAFEASVLALVGDTMDDRVSGDGSYT